MTEIETIVRSLKSELGLRPIWHQKDDRIAVHLFVAFHAVRLLRTCLKAAGITLSRDSMRNRLHTRLRITTTICRTDRSTIDNRQPTGRAAPSRSRADRPRRGSEATTVPLENSPDKITKIVKTWGHVRRNENYFYAESFLQNCRPDRFFALSRLILLSRAWVSGPPRGMLCFHNNKIPRR